MRIDSAVAGDWAAIESLLRAASLPVEDLAGDLLDGFLVARIKNPIVDIAGAIGLENHGDIGLLRSLVVHPEVQGGGIAAALVSEIEAVALRSGIDQLYLLTIDADGYFLRHGFEIVARNETPAPIRATREFSELCPDDAIVMRKVLRDT